MSLLVDRLLQAFGRYAFLTTGETMLQASIGKMLTDEDFEYEREVRLSARDRIDFLVGDVGVEIKVAGSWRDVRRQLARYAESPRIRALLLVTVRPTHQYVPEQIGGVPVYVHVLRNAEFW